METKGLFKTSQQRAENWNECKYLTSFSVFHFLKIVVHMDDADVRGVW